MVLGISVENDPESVHTDEQNFNTHQEMEFDEWEDLFQNVLQAPVEIERLEGEDRAAFLSRRERLFKEDLKGKGYEMLGRIWYVFRDVFYSPAEIDKLLEECLELKRKTESPKALSALEKLIRASRAALKVNSGIFLACD
jgi:hypothetical protein